ncbi:cytochrome C biogenesis protein [Bacillus sp. AFS076308]|uniref:cytochrome c biogenesis protein ResB n=1 Tax=unclassified Bacillus (in: firmicutes) TaxID=185979 RepID=UPI000BF76B72|nr:MULTISPECIES: cytochrome c biogenesis protein ResB [unclassified Bacillus (in: firmicutes)]PFN78821.1 cytochrome C biogenesis protein [Bacillus sp. AFS076308]PGV49052.1 cytochrome C biogenesis protein [Bacillus sp. AFS037270]
MNDVKCECGHVNPHGTVLCEACGKVLDEQEKNNKELLDMRYEGSARRSQTYNKTIIDKIWNFFSSVKVGIWLIVITLVASTLGTILPQKMYINLPPEVYYEQEYGWFGKLYYQLGLHDLYGSWWYLLLIAMIGISLVICSLDRVVPLYKALKAQRVTRHEGFLRRQRIFGVTEHPEEKDLAVIKNHLKERRYQVREENGDLLAEKGRFSRWGPYVNHVGLIIFLLGAMLRFIPGFYVNEDLWVKEGETAVVPETGEKYYLKNNQFILQHYDKNKDKTFEKAIEQAGQVVKNYQSNVVLYERVSKNLPGEKPELKRLKEYKVRVNHPLDFNGYSVFQSSYRSELKAMTFVLANKKTGQSFGMVKVDLEDPKAKYDLGNGYSVNIINYFPDFEFDKNGEPSTKSRLPNNPAFVFQMTTPDKSKPETSFVAIKQTIEPFGENTYKMAFQGIETKNVSGFTVRKDSSLWVIILGGIVFMIGVIQGAYWNHRRIWVQNKNGQIWIAAHTNKNWYGIKREIETVLKDTKLDIPEDQQQKESMDKEGV